MFKVNEEETAICFEISSDMKLAERVARASRDFAEMHCGGDTSNFVIIIRELLINAIEHGNKNDYGKQVVCSVEKISDSRFKIEINDEGNGFDMANMDMSIPDDPEAKRSRGLPLINAYSDELKFENEGTRAIAYCTIEKDINFSVSEDSEWIVVSPSGNISSENVGELKKLLLGYVDSGSRFFRFDFGSVEEIDSMGLSVLVVLSNMLAKNKGKKGLEIIHISSSLTNLFRLTRLDRIYKLC